MSTRLIIILTILDSTVSTAAAVLKSTDADDQGLDDELAAFLQTVHERIQAFLTRPPAA